MKIFEQLEASEKRGVAPIPPLVKKSQGYQPTRNPN